MKRVFVYDNNIIIPANVHWIVDTCNILCIIRIIDIHLTQLGYLLIYFQQFRHHDPQVRFLFDQRIYNIIYYNDIILHGIPPLYIIDIYTPMYMFACSYTYYILYTLLSRGAQYALYTILYYIRDLLV